ncbi:alpha/beta fold hydrolase [Rhodococcus sp. IEGM1428]|uniref:alpha/beta fold hydrolase n=1 Tax=Rhodococcus sp. IEGM1428 TaxID=3392191 RepID=UPI003D134EB3
MSAKVLGCPLIVRCVGAEPGYGLCGESGSWIDRLHDRVVRRKPDIDSVVVHGAGHLVHLDRPIAFVAAVRGSDHPGLMRPSVESPHHTPVIS